MHGHVEVKCDSSTVLAFEVFGFHNQSMDYDQM